MTKNNKTYGGVERIFGVCSICGIKFDDYNGQPYRKYVCRECHNAKSRIASRKVASTLKGHLHFALKDIKNNRKRNKRITDIDLEYLLKLYEFQKGRCAISNIEMTIGFGDSDYNGIQHTKPYNISIDRLDNSKGYLKGNVILICTSVNMFKGTHDVSVVYNIANEITKNKERLTEIVSNLDTLDNKETNIESAKTNENR